MVRLCAAIVLLLGLVCRGQLAFDISDPNVAAWIQAVAAGTPSTPPIGFTMWSTTNETTARSSYVSSPTYTPNSNALVLAVVVNSKASAPNTPTFSGNGLTWVQVGTTNFNTLASPTQRLTVFRAMGSAPTSGAGTADFGGANQTGCAIAVCEFTNVSVIGSGSGALVQTNFNATNTVVNPWVNMSALNANLQNAAIALAGNAVNGFGATPEAGWTEDIDIGYNTPATGLYVTHTNLTGDNTVLITQGSAVSWAVCGLEVKSLTNSAPGIINQPANLTVAPNNDATFSVYALGRLPLAYQWYSDSIAATAVGGATSSSYTKSNCQLTDSGTNYCCVITNIYGSLTSSVATLTVSAGVAGPPGIYGTVTNGGTTGTVITNTLPNTASANRGVAVLVSWYLAAGTTIAEITNSTGQAGVLRTNYQWWLGSANTKSAVYTFTNTAATESVMVRFASAPSEWTIKPVGLSNWNYAIGAMLTNSTTGAGSQISNTVSSASNELVIGFDTLAMQAAGLTAPTLSASETLLSASIAAASTHADAIFYQTGQTTTTNFIFWNGDGGDHGLGVISFKGF